ncbi:uncharacterized protein LOC143358530 [Halictus rubicundus]|uniref:uncharacterized protein LOC143358530 n=1 Tax=Halictus rubicundus TaxID=77578 RepID=UPI004035ED4F
MEKQVPGTSKLSPPKKNPSGKFVVSSQKKIIINLYKSALAEKPEIKYKALVLLLSKQTGIGRTTIIKTLSEYKTTGAVTSPNKKRPRLNILEKTSDDDIIAIRKKVSEFWFRREIPNMKKILEAVNTDEELPSFSESSLYRLLKRMGFKFIVRKRNSALIDQPDIVCWRQQYIRKIRSLRTEGRPIYFLDETMINAGDCRRKLQFDSSVSCPKNTAQRGLSTDIPASLEKGKRLIIAHVGSSDGFVPGALLCFEAKRNTGDYHNEMNGDIFLEWFRKFLPMLRDGAVIVMDNESYHSVKLERYPTIGWQKKDIITWLKGKGEKLDPSYVKSQLVMLVEKYRHREDNYVIDEYAKEHGCTVLRLPPYHCQLNPIELAWARIKEYIKARNTTNKMADVRQLLDEAVESVSAESWQDFIRHATEEEDSLHQLDTVIDSVLENEGVWLYASDDSENDV